MSLFDTSSTEVKSVVINGVVVPVSAIPQTPPLDIAAATSSTVFTKWCQNVDPRFSLTSIQFQSIDYFGPRVGFVKFICSGSFQGKPVPGVVFGRGSAVGILAVLTCEGERWVVCCRQPRLPVGRHMLELPAGMMDDAGSFVGVAAKEMQEETGIEINEGDLFDLTEKAYGAGTSGGAGGKQAILSGGPIHGMYPSSGACDEYIRLFYWTKEVSKDYLTELQGKTTGCAAEGENIRIELVKYEDMWKTCPDCKAHSAMYLLEKLEALGLVTNCGLC